MYGPTHPWVVPLGMSHLDFLGLIKFLKIIRKSFKNVMLVPFQMNSLIKNINLKHDLRIFWMLY
jgi:hypothetical protein